MIVENTLFFFERFGPRGQEIRPSWPSCPTPLIIRTICTYLLLAHSITTFSRLVMGWRELVWVLPRQWQRLEYKFIQLQQCKTKENTLNIMVFFFLLLLKRIKDTAWVESNKLEVVCVDWIWRGKNLPLFDSYSLKRSMARCTFMVEYFVSYYKSLIENLHMLRWKGIILGAFLMHLGGTKSNFGRGFCLGCVGFWFLEGITKALPGRSRET